MTPSAAKSSTTDTVRTKTRSPAGMRLPTRESRPSANAVSVDMATPQPCVVPWPALTAR